MLLKIDTRERLLVDGSIDVDVTPLQEFGSLFRQGVFGGARLS